MIDNENPETFADSETGENAASPAIPDTDVSSAVSNADETVATEPAVDESVVDESADAEDAEAGSGDALADAAAALGDTSAEDQEAAYRKRLREFTRELKKLPGTWYIVQTYAGYENKVKTNLDMRAQTLEVEEYIHDVVVPIEQAVEIKDGKRKIVKRKLLPGYVLVRMELNDSSWSVVRDTPGVTSFVGNEGNATPVKHRDVAKFLLPKDAPAEGAAESAAPGVAQDGELAVAMPEEDAKPKFAYDFEVGDAVTILDGAFASVAASISSIDPVTGRIEALVSIFGRETPVELTADQIEKIS
ncbi:hypothetical protein CGUA_02275 [Corynebacterium guangdongense]|uniref:Transcription termination/antitermination protein NusG n=1 Tax=Corynebacterium guangdongense TaxID=1783348 RepID=A0ABU1ZU68_9CORY|nr:transcription termination/antitermination protein NusG [Corynebacterium guangdongense]MDR7328474.1 transcriptional antiterminator NusG [Corynebacterium guangdongense]WJZ17051.1 hypothetical protein CGUA_02275 [Corynebacterium guangdongense]